MRASIVIFVAALATASSCTPPDQSSSEGEPIIGGTPITATDRLIKILFKTSDGTGFICTGTLITPQYVLTAAHCSDGVLSSYSATLGSTSSGVDLIKGHMNLDLALLHLTTPLASSSFKSFMYTGWSNASDSLNGKGVQEQGFGCNAVSSCDTACTGWGTLRWGNLTGANHDQYNVNYDGPNSAGGGDSGGPVWYFYNSIPYQTGVTKGGDCPNGLTFASDPEIFEPWVFASIYGSPVPIPTTTACHNYSCPYSTGVGEWNTPGGPRADFWERPLAANTSQCTAPFNPCPGSSNYYIWRGDWSLNGSDSITVKSQYETDTVTGTSNNGYWGSGNMQICYSTGPSGTSPGMNWMDVQCDRGIPPESLVCHGTRCRNTVDPLPPSKTQTVSWKPCGGGSFWYYLVSSTVGPDYVAVGGTHYVGNWNTLAHSDAGSVNVSYSTGSANNYSHGIYSLYATCDGW